MFYLEQRLQQLDDASGKKLSVLPPPSSPSSPSMPVPSLDSAMDDRLKVHQKAHRPSHTAPHPSKTKPISVFKQLAAKRMSATPPAKVTATSSMTPSSSSSLASPSLPTASETVSPPTPSLTPPAATTGAIQEGESEEEEEEEEEEEDNDNFAVNDSVVKKRTSVSMLFSPMAEAEEDTTSSTNTNTSASSSSSNSITSSTSSSTGSISTSTSTSTSPRTGPPPTVSGGGKRKPGRLSILQLNVGKDFTPAMLAGAKPKPGLVAGGVGGEL